MVALRPAKMKLESFSPCPGPENFQRKMCSLEYRFVDLSSQGDEGSDSQWVNSGDSVTFELRQPSSGEMAELALAIGRLRPDHIDYMHSSGGQCLVYWMKWNRPSNGASA